MLHFPPCIPQISILQYIGHDLLGLNYEDANLSKADLALFDLSENDISAGMISYSQFLVGSFLLGLSQSLCNSAIVGFLARYT